MIDDRLPRIQEALDVFAASGPSNTAYVEVLDGSGLSAGVGADRQMPLASVSKILIAETLLRHGPSTDELVAVKELCLSVDHGSVLVALDLERELSIRELMALSLAVSDNGIADYLARRCGIDALNETAAELGMADTVIVNGLSDDDLEELPRANVSTARDVGLLLRAVAERRDENEDRARIWLGLCNGVSARRLPKFIPGDIKVAHKTGTLGGVCNDSGVVMTEPPVIVSAFCDGVEETSAAELTIGTMSHAVCEIATGRSLVKG